jgi:glycosyltransferase involved in cell wall biosynthesis
MAKLPVSVCLISGAEAGRIRRALQSVAERASEVIVVLNEDVRDGTDALCAARGAKVYREPWKGFVGQKNSAADKASGPWILSLDADEEVPPALWDEIAAAIADPARNGPYAAFDFPRCSFYCDRWIRHGDWYPDRVLRLWRKGSAAWTGIEIHERLEVKGAIGHLRSDLLHYSNQSINWQLDKIGRYADPFVRHCLATGRRAGWLDLTIRPVWKFLRAYIFKLGFLDGWPGYYIAWLGAFSTVTRYAKVREARLKSAK